MLDDEQVKVDAFVWKAEEDEKGTDEMELSMHASDKSYTTIKKNDISDLISIEKNGDEALQKVHKHVQMKNYIRCVL